MRAVVFNRLGPPDVLRMVDVEKPYPGPGQVRVRVRAVGVQPFDAAVRRGALDVPVSFPQRLGNEFSGVIDAVGDDVEDWSTGDDVLGWRFMESLAEYVLADVNTIVRKPADMPWDVAGAMSSSGHTAYTALRELGVATDDTLLVHGAAGGAGTVAVQLARAWGTAVIGTASETNHQYLAELGVTPVRYGDGLVERVRAIAPDGVDAALDAVGGKALRDSLVLVRDRNRIGTLVDHDVATELGVRGLRAQRSIEQLRDLVALYEKGALRIAIRATFPLEAVADAHRLVETGHGRGKVVVRVDDGEKPT